MRKKRMSTAYCWQKTCLANTLSLHIMALCTMNDLWQERKKNNIAKTEPEREKKSTKKMAKWKCEYIEMRSTILFYIVWHTSHNFFLSLSHSWLSKDVKSYKHGFIRIIAWIYFGIRIPSECACVYVYIICSYMKMCFFFWVKMCVCVPFKRFFSISSFIQATCSCH